MRSVLRDDVWAVPRHVACFLKTWERARFRITDGAAIAEERDVRAARPAEIKPVGESGLRSDLNFDALLSQNSGAS